MDIECGIGAAPIDVPMHFIPRPADRPRRDATPTPERFSDLVDSHHAVIARLVDRTIK
jgi:hypothetical protein